MTGSTETDCHLGLNRFAAKSEVGGLSPIHTADVEATQFVSGVYWTLGIGGGNAIRHVFHHLI